ncbi:MAG: hypothetical protein BRC28_00840 [Nanohaloarchaea archaeon SW_4_43_9]|nr:MAG: hypothetical protein BRC28_00840 [Nanohaloarchaea archaeon SW_4_43_9]
MAGVLDRVRNYFSNREETVKLSEAANFYREENSEGIERAERKAENLMQETDELLGEFEDSLEELKGYEHEKDIQAVEDVADNFYTSRKKMLRRFEDPDEIREHSEEFGKLVEEVNDVSRKEGEVLKFIEKQSGDLPGVIQKLVDHKEKLEEFLEKEYFAVEVEEELEEVLEEIDERREEISELEDEIEDSTVENLENNLEDARENLRELENSEEWMEKEDKQNRIEKLEDERDRILSNLSKEVSRTERPVKKVLYSIKNDETEFDSNHEKLEKMLDREFKQLEGLDRVLGEVGDLMEKEDIVDKDKQKKFEDAREELSRLDERKEELRQKEQEIEIREQELEDMSIQEEAEKLEKKIGELENRIDEAERERSRKRQLVEDKKKEIEDRRNRVRSLIENSLGFEVKLR